METLKMRNDAFSKWIKIAEDTRLLSQTGFRSTQIKKIRSCFFLLRNSQEKPLCLLETKPMSIVKDDVFSDFLIEKLPNHCIKFPSYTVSIESPSKYSSKNLFTLFHVKKIMPRRHHVGTLKPSEFARWMNGAMYAAKGAKQ